MISDKKYVNASKMEQPIIKSVGFNNEDVLITENGEYEAKSPYTGFGKVVVDVPPVEIIAKYTNKYIVDENGVVSQPNKIMDFNGIKEVNEDYVFYYMYFNNKKIDGEADLSSINIISGYNACSYMFADSNIKSLNLSGLKEIKSNINNSQYQCSRMCENCVNLENVYLDSLELVDGFSACNRMFSGCSKLRNLYFPAIKTNSFGSLRSQFSGMCSGDIDITLHFPSNVQSVVETLSGYSLTAPFGATSGTILFDLPATE